MDRRARVWIHSPRRAVQTFDTRAQCVRWHLTLAVYIVIVIVIGIGFGIGIGIDIGVRLSNRVRGLALCQSHFASQVAICTLHVVGF